jgi:hypothetical protein
VIGKASRSDNLGVLQVAGAEVVLGSSRNGPFTTMALFAAGVGAAMLGKLHDTWDVSCYDGQASQDGGGLVKVEPNGDGIVLTVYDYVANTSASVPVGAGGVQLLAAAAAGLLFDM